MKLIIVSEISTPIENYGSATVRNGKGLGALGRSYQCDFVVVFTRQSQLEYVQLFDVARQSVVSQVVCERLEAKLRRSVVRHGNV